MWTPQLTDYIYCSTCETVVDFWKYDYDLESAGHDGHEVRQLTEAEYQQALENCRYANCFGDE